MKQKDIPDLPILDSTRLERLFNVYQTDNGVYFYNLLNTINFINTSTIDPSIYFSYTIVPGDTYTLISYKHYKTIDLWWLICSFNEIQNPVLSPIAGIQLKILYPELINNILLSLA